MGIIRGGLSVVIGVLLFISFLAGNIFLTLNSSLEYETIRPELISVVKDIAEKDMDLTNVMGDQFETMMLYCQNNSEFILSQEGHTFIIPCETISKGPESVIEKGINDLIEEIYYKDYDCDFFLDCSKQSTYPFFLVSKKAKDYWMEKFYISLIVAIILIIAMLIIMEHRLNLPITVGSILIVSSLPFMKLTSILSLFDTQFLQFIIIFFSKSYDVFWISFTGGLIILIIGLILKLFKAGFKINGFFSWIERKRKEKNLSKDKKGEVISKEHIKEIVKQEISKHKQKDKIQ